MAIADKQAFFVSGSGSNTGGSSAALSGLSSLMALLQKQAAGTDVYGQARQEDITAQQQTQADYSKENAFTDAQGLMNKALADTMQQLLPSINMASEGAGASQGSMRALLLQQAAQKAATEAAALGAQQAVDYGNISNSAGSVLEALTRQDTSAAQALIEAMKLKLAAAQTSTPSTSSVSIGTPSNQKTIGAKPNPTQNQGLASAVFLPSNTPASTSSFFNRPGGVLDQGGSVSVGPTASLNDVLNSQTKAILGDSVLNQEGARAQAGNAWNSGLSF